VGPGLVWTGAENLSPPGFDTRTVQSVAIRYIDYASRPASRRMVGAKYRRQSRDFLLPQAVITLHNNPLDTIWCKPTK
jgi:hypothetical protein